MGGRFWPAGHSRGEQYVSYLTCPLVSWCARARVLVRTPAERRERTSWGSGLRVRSKSSQVKSHCGLEAHFPVVARRWPIFWTHGSRYDFFGYVFAARAAWFTVDKLLFFKWYTTAAAPPRDRVPHRPRFCPMRRVRARPVATSSAAGFSRKAGRTFSAGAACAHAGYARLRAMHGGAVALAFGVCLPDFNEIGFGTNYISP